VLLAWRRADVRDLNRLARHRWDRLGQLHGDDVEVAQGRWYTVGDRLAALAPNKHVGIVTSEPLTVLDVTEGAMTVRTEAGRSVTVTGDALDGEHLDYGYALTVHRAQGTTCDRAHVLAAGGGRELAYVALSRARDHTTVHATADTLEQVVHDLQDDWSTETHQRWIADTPARPGSHPEPVVAGEMASLDPSRRLRVLTDDYHDLQAGTGRWTHTSVGIAARARNQTRAQLDDARRDAQNPNLRRRERRAAAKALGTLIASRDHAEQHWQVVGEPGAEQLRDEIAETRREAEHRRVTETRQSLDRYLSPSRPGPSIDTGRDLGIGL
jgi:hypothetical protein